MQQAILLYSIADLMERKFFIPSYQRGYRWTSQQVIDLLNDAHTFAIKKNKKEKEFYCLQPIVVKKHNWKDSELNEISGWEIVDGQQRLTTIRIILEYLIREHLRGASLESEYGKDVYCLHYQTRLDTGYFLQNIQEGVVDDIDQYHIAEAYKTVKDWFEQQTVQRDAREAILRTLVYDEENQKSEGILQVIWYEIEDSKNPIDTFVRINLGKIPLTNAELIKALFLQRRNFGPTEDELARLKQLEIANDWDRIENSLQQNDFWAFLNKQPINPSSRIELILDTVCRMACTQNPELLKVTGTDNHATFRYFYHLLGTQPTWDQTKKCWDKLIECYNTLYEWYSHPQWYHYIGFLVECGDTIDSLLKMINEGAFTKKEEVTEQLDRRIKSKFAHLKWIYQEEENDYCLDLSYKSTDPTSRRFLLLFNLECVVIQSLSKSSISKFPFQTYRDKKWDVEHIDSTTENALRDRNSRIEWLQNALIDMPDIKDDLELYTQCADFIANENTKYAFEVLNTKIIMLAGESNNEEASKNNIGNLALLDAQTNRAYGNALFTTKRRIVIEKDKKGLFIPICTKNVFLKYFNNAVNIQNKWTNDDIRAYRKEMQNILKRFLPGKPNNKR